MMQSALSRWIAFVLTGLCLLGPLSAATGLAASGRGGQLKLIVVDEKGQPLPVRMHLKSSAGKQPKLPKTIGFHDHIAFAGEITLRLPNGAYSFEIERGLEYLPRIGHFEIADFADDEKPIDLKRFVDMTSEGWWSGDLDVQRPEADLPLLMLADDLHVANLVAPPAKSSATKPIGKAATKRPAKSKQDSDKTIDTTQPLVQVAADRFYYRFNQALVRPSGRVLLLNLKEPLEPGKLAPEYPPTLALIDQARDGGNTWVDVPQPSSWDLPVWIAAGKVNSIELASGQLYRDGVQKDAPGKPRDRLRFPEPHGSGRWSEAIYYQLLNCGLRIPPSAGSASGTALSPVGYNRVYVHLDGEFSWDKWWQGLHAGQTFVTNGPLIRPTVEGELPGHVFQADKGQEIELEIGLTLSTREKVAYLEVIKNGSVAYDVRLDEWAKGGGKMPKLKFNESGWFLLRAVTANQKTYRFASTAPYYVEIGYERRISKESAQFFLDWVDERARQIKLDNPDQQAEIDKLLGAARAYWQALVDKANAE